MSWNLLGRQILQLTVYNNKLYNYNYYYNYYININLLLEIIIIAQSCINTQLSLLHMFYDIGEMWKKQ